MSKKPKVSVLVLNWNGKRFIDQFMKSYLQQDYPKDALELLFIDNNSSDDSLAYTEREYANKYPNIKLVKNDKIMATPGETTVAYIRQLDNLSWLLITI